MAMAPVSLSQIPLFATLPPEEIAHLEATLQPRAFPAQAILLHEGNADEHFYVLLEGNVEIIKALDTTDERVLAVSAGPDLLGEMSMFSAGGRHTASVRSVPPVKLLEITRFDLDNLLRRQPGVAYELVRVLSTRLDDSEKTTILDLREKNRQLTVAYQELQAAQQQLVEKERLERELEIARQIQYSVLPQTLPQPPGFDIGALINPARAVGGDFYDMIPLGDQHLGIVVGDVCDKGVPAALFMMRTYSVLRAKAGRHTAPAQVLRLVNRDLLRRNPSGMFATLLYGILDCGTGRFSYARAGHPVPIVLDEQSRPQPVRVASGQPLGLWPAPALDEETTALPIGGMALVFSDGLSEAMGGPPQAGWLEALCSRLAARPGETAQGVCDKLWQEVVRLTTIEHPRDDFVVVAIKRTK